MRGSGIVLPTPFRRTIAVGPSELFRVPPTGHPGHVSGHFATGHFTTSLRPDYNPCRLWVVLDPDQIRITKGGEPQAESPSEVRFSEKPGFFPTADRSPGMCLGALH